jgi:Flp pilus assembly protein TadD
MKSIGLTSSISALALGAMLTFSFTDQTGALENDTSEVHEYLIVDSNSLLGSYLAGRLARSMRDNLSAAGYYREALNKHPESKEILEEAFQLKVATGEFTEAHELAEDLVNREGEHKVASFFLGIEAFKQGRHGEAEKHFVAGGSGPIADLTSRLARAWVAFERGKVTEALKITSDSETARTQGAQQIEMLHSAMIADLADRRKTALKLYKDLYRTNVRNVRISVAYARHAARWGNTKLAKEILEPHLQSTYPNPLVQAVWDEIAAGKKPDFVVTTSTEGLAQVFQGIGEALTGDGVVDAGQIYLQLALLAKPDAELAHYALGELYDQISKHEAAASAFAQVSKDSALWLNAQLGQAYALNSLERVDEAKTLLTNLVAAYPDDTRAYTTLGTILRANKEYGEAVTYYTKAIEKLGKENPSHWSTYYSRGVSYERLKKWEQAEADLEKALELDPDQELVLNYLGYSWVDQNINVKQAMSLIRRAVDKRPQDGYFVDSLGWAYYRQKQFDQAVKHLEHAVELKPDDPVINDHLGDAYWKVGRKLEATYQWNYSLGLEPEPEDEKKIREKLQNGLVDEPTTRASLDETASQKKRKTE